MNVLMLSGCDPSGRYMIERLRESRIVHGAIRIRWRPRPAKPDAAARPPAPQRVLRLPAKVARRAQREFLDWHFERLDRGLSRALFGTDEPPEIECDHEVISHEINSEAFAHRLRALAPDLLLVNGAPILRRRIFSIPPLGVVNVHFGIAPAYRGVSTLFWPMYYGDFDNLGVSLHYINGRVDGGAVLAHGYPYLTADDTEATVMAKCTELAVDLARSFTRARERGPVEGRRQTDKGRLFLKRQRQGWQDVHFQVRRRLGMLRVPERPARVETYFEGG